jgi:thioredoxin 1
MPQVTLSQDNFQSEVIESDQPCLIDFWAPWCGPCLMMGPALENIAEEYAGKAKICKLNVDENAQLATMYGIRSIPALLFFKDGEVVAQAIGVQTEIALTNQLDDMME